MSIIVGIVGTVAPERCGIAVYNEELIQNCKRDNPDIQFVQVGRPFDGSIVDRLRHVDIVHLSHVCNLYGGVTVDHIKQLRSMGKGLICTWHDSTPNNKSLFCDTFHVTVVHQKTNDGYTLLYHGVPHAKIPPGPRALAGFVGTSGFPIPFKNYPLAAKLAKAVGKKLYAFLPESQHGDVMIAERDIMRENPGSVVYKGFPSHEHIVQTLSQCDFTLFPYRHETTGVGGSMRVGIGAQRPVVITDVVRFIDILTEPRFRKEFYIIPSAYPTFENALPTVLQVVDDIGKEQERIPVETMKEMSWQVSAWRYANLYRELMRRTS